MPTKRQFDMVVITVVLVLVAAQVARAAANRWQHQGSGIAATLGTAVSA